MSSRDSLFPATSIGRPQPRLKPQGSQESLTAHPLLSTPSNPNTPLQIHPAPHEPSDTLHSNQATTPPRYIPYTPRQRPLPSSPTTSAATQSSVSVIPPHHVHSHGGATGKLQIQNLKAAAQSIGLSSGSVGWAMLEKFIGDQDLGEWEHAWSQLTAGRATLLLPSEQLSGRLDVSIEFIRDHVAFCSGWPSPTSSVSLVTLSGLRAVVENEKLTFRSSISPSGPLYAPLLKHAIRPTSFLSLPPLPNHLPPPSLPFPALSVLQVTTSLPCPSRPQAPPPLPARPTSTRTQASSSSTSSTSRLNPFASLFGRSPASSASVTPAPSLSPKQASLSLPSTSTTPDIPTKHDVQLVPAFVVNHSIRRTDVAKDVGKALKAQVTDVLGSKGHGLPKWIVSRTMDFASSVHRKYWSDIGGAHSGSSSASGEAESNEDKQASTVSKPADKHHNEVDVSTLSATVDTFQSFLSSLEADMSTHWHSLVGLGAKASERSAPNESKEDGERSTTSTTDVPEKDLRLRQAMNAVEGLLCTLFYDRLFSPEDSDDKRHDEALAGRVAALNMLDLGLDHLGVEVPTEGQHGVELVVQNIGQELQKLSGPSYQSPGEKVALLVSVHNLAVEGLSKLPPVRLKPEEELEQDPLPDADKTPVKASFPPPIRDDAALNKSSELITLPAEAANSLISPEPAVPISPSPPQTPAPFVPPVVQITPEADLTTSPDVVTSAVPDIASEKPLGKPTPVSSDVLLPIIIYAVVKSNPAQLVSHLLYTQRYRHTGSSGGGEESFCLINLMAVAEFLENVDMAALGLAEADRVSVADLSPIPLPPSAPEQSPIAEINLSARLRGRVDRQVGEIAGSASKVLSGVVDSSFSRLRGLLSSEQQQTSAPSGGGPPTSPTATTHSAPGFGLLRRGSGFSIASMAANLPGASILERKATAPPADEAGQQLIDVSSRPASMREAVSEAEPESDGGDEEESDDEEDDEEDDALGGRSDVRSVRSFSSMMSRDSKESRRQRKSLSDRLANVSARFGASNGAAGGSVARDIAGLRKPSPPGSRRASLLLSPPGTIPQVITEPPSATTPTTPQIAPPIERFLDISAADLKIGDIPVLLRDYRRLAEALRLHNGFLDPNT